MIKDILLIGGCGYIGSYLYQRLTHYKHNIIVCDQQIRGNPAQIPVSYTRYQDIPEIDLHKFDAILWFAGHSSVNQSLQEPAEALRNNALDLFEFVTRVPQKTKFIYASTASLYSSDVTDMMPSNELSLLAIPDTNPYDRSKFIFDYLAKNYITNFYGLRMGTLAGYSPNLRAELVFNAMSLSASQEGLVKLYNNTTMRTILYLEDLWVLVKNLLMFNNQSGIYNAGSFTGAMGDIAMSIANEWDAKVIYLGDSPTYSFAMDCKRMQVICGKELYQDTLGHASRNFITNKREDSINV